MAGLFTELGENRVMYSFLGESIGYTGVYIYGNAMNCSFKICISLYIHFTFKKKSRAELGWLESV